MDLYKFHPEPETLLHHDIAHEKVPVLIWDKYKRKPTELKKREAILAQDAKTAYSYAVRVLRGRFPAGEEAIAKSSGPAYQYAAEVLKDRFPAGEAAIATNIQYAVRYAAEVLKGRFPAGEAVIAKDAEGACAYAIKVLKNRFPAGEEAIAKNANTAYSYAKNVLKAPWSKGEAAIAKNAQFAFLYAENVLGGPWSKGEAAIAKDANFAYSYAVDVLKDRFPAAEAVIAKDEYYGPKYKADFLRDNLSDTNYSDIESGLIIAWDRLLYMNNGNSLPTGPGNSGFLQQDMHELLSLIKEDDDEDEILEFIEYVDEGCRRGGVPSLTKSLLDKIFTETANKSKIASPLTIYIPDNADEYNGWVTCSLVENGLDYDGELNIHTLKARTPVIFMKNVKGTNKNGLIIHSSDLN